ncbi:hypothetical protein GCM10027612_68150 [Microbispora bryophytorum subsp. camponoti]
MILADNGRIFVTGPDVVRSVTGEETDMASLGGPEPHSKRSGVVHVVTKDEPEAMLRARQLACLLGHQGRVRGDVDEVDFGTLLPDNPRRAYDVHPLVKGLLDEPGVELHPKWAPNIVTTLGGSAAARSASSPTTPCGSAAALTPPPRRRPPGSSGCVMPSGCRWWCSWTCRATSPGSARSTTGSYGAARSCCTRSPRRPCPASH